MNRELAKLYTDYLSKKNAANGNKEIIKKVREELLEAITDENINDLINEDGEVLLHNAVNDDDPALLEGLLAKQAKFNIKSKYELSPMQTAIIRNKNACVIKLVQYGGDIDERDLQGESELFSAVKFGNYERVQLLLALDANVYANNNHNYTIMDCMADLLSNKDVEQKIKFKIVRLLLESYIGIGTSFDGIDLPQGVTDGLPVILAIKADTPITNQTPNFEKAICNFHDLLKSKMFNLRKLQSVLEKVFKPYFPGEKALFMYEHDIFLLKESGLIRANNFVKAGPELEQLYKDLRVRTAGVASLKELTATSLLLQQGLKLQKNKPIDAPQLTPNGDVILPPDAAEYIEDLAEDIEKKLGHDRSGTK